MAMPSSPAPAARSGFLVAVAGVLPVVGYFAEVATGMFRESVCDLFPTRWHSFAVGLAVLLNLRMWIQREGNLVYRAAALGYVTGTVLTYMVATAIDLPVMFVAILIAGLGILALAPWWAGLGLCWLWPQLVRDWRKAGRRPLHLFALALPTLGVVPAWIITARIQDLRTFLVMENASHSMRPEVVGPSFEWLRSAPMRAQEALCAVGMRGIDGGADSGHPLAWFVDAICFTNAGGKLSADEAREVFHLAHGRDWQPDDESLQLKESAQVITVERDAALAKLDWQLLFANTAPFAGEAKAEIALPAAAVASDLSLWINGVEQRAAFDGVRKVESAYRAVVDKQRDPALLVESAPGRLELSLFPVLPQKPLRVRVQLTVPLHLRDEDAWLELPVLRAPRIQTASAKATRTVWDAGVQEEWSGRFDAAQPPALRFARGALRSRCQDVDGFIRQELVPTTTPASAPAPWVIALDGSTTARQGLPEAASLLSALPQGAPCTLLVAQDLGFVEASGKPEGPELSAALAKCSFVGGVDAAPMLRRAVELAGQRPGTRVLWLHGRQPVLHSSQAGAALAAFRMQVRSAGAPLLALPLVQGTNLVLDALGDLVVQTPRTADLAADVRWITTRGLAFEAAERRFLRGDTADPADAAVSDQLARVWAALQARAMWQRGERDTATRLAQKYRLVTAGAGAVVLETAEQYAQAGLEPAAPAGYVPPGTPSGNPVPEPETWLLVASGLLLAWLRLVVMGRR
jgi:hypothetical protein